MLNNDLKNVADYIRTGKQPTEPAEAGSPEGEESFHSMLYRLRDGTGPARVDLKEVPAVINTDEMDEESIDAIKAFGINAPGELNFYATQLEDDLITTIHRLTSMTKQYVEMRRSFEALQASVGGMIRSNHQTETTDDA